MRLEINHKEKKNYKKKPHKHLKAKQYSTIQATDHWENQRGKFKKSRDK